MTLLMNKHNILYHCPVRYLFQKLILGAMLLVCMAVCLNILFNPVEILLNWTHITLAHSWFKNTDDHSFIADLDWTFSNWFKNFKKTNPKKTGKKILTDINDITCINKKEGFKLLATRSSIYLQQPY